MASYKASDQITFNAQASRGFRLGGINDPLNVPICTPQDLVTFGGRDSWKDETAWNYEIGTKSTLMDGRASLNVSAYYMDIRDLQLTVTAGSCTSRLVFNVPKARSSGLEVEFGATPNEHFDFSLNASLNNGQLRSTLTSTDASHNVTVVSGIKEATVCRACRRCRVQRRRRTVGASGAAHGRSSPRRTVMWARDTP